MNEPDEDDSPVDDPSPDGLPTKPPPPPPPGVKRRRRLSARPEEDFEITDRAASFRGGAGGGPLNLEVWTLR